MTERQNGLKKGASTFKLVGKVSRFGKYTFQMDEASKKADSDWVYNSLNLGINCGEECGIIYSNLMGGYGTKRDNLVYVHGKNEDGNDDFTNRFTIDWDDRKDPEVLNTVGRGCFYRAGLLKDKNGNVVVEEFVHAYDFIKYIRENLEEDTVVSLHGNLKYTLNNKKETVITKEIKSIYLSDATPNDYSATFKQTILLDKDSLDVKNYDRDKGCVTLACYVVDYLRDFNGVDVKESYPFKVDFEYKIDISDKERYVKVLNLLFKVKKNVTKTTFEGKLVEGGAVVTATYDDLEEDIKALVDNNIYTLEDALTQCSVSESRERRMLLVKPSIKTVKNDDGTSTSSLQKEEDAYEESDLEFVLPEKDKIADKETVETLEDDELAELNSLLEGLGA